MVRTKGLAWSKMLPYKSIPCGERPLCVGMRCGEGVVGESELLNIVQAKSGENRPIFRRMGAADAWLHGETADWIQHGDF